MSYIQVTNQFVNTTPLLATACNQNFADLTSGMSSGLNDFNVAQFTANGSATVAGDIYTVKTFDWSPNCNAVGWANLINPYVNTKKIGKTVLITYYLSGHSSSVTAYMYLPYNANASLVFSSLNYLNYSVLPNSTATIGTAYFPYPNIVAFNVSVSSGAGAWSPLITDAKTVYGNLFYEAV
jgi:hypothetical protein